jgi:dCTP deaminase
MILSDGEILAALKDGSLGIDPMPTKEQIQPASVDLRLGNQFSSFNETMAPYSVDTRNGEIVGHDGLNVSRVMTTREVVKTFNLGPNDFVLGHTVERVRVPSGLVGVVDGRSSLGRLGVMVHITAGYIDPGFEGQITLELYNVSPLSVFLYPGDRICQIRFHRMGKSSLNPYRGRYQGDSGAVASRIHYER